MNSIQLIFHLKQRVEVTNYTSQKHWEENNRELESSRICYFHLTYKTNEYNLEAKQGKNLFPTLKQHLEEKFSFQAGV